jgi:hypothetical protein
LYQLRQLHLPNLLHLLGQLRLVILLNLFHLLDRLRLVRPGCLEFPVILVDQIRLEAL